MHKEINTHMETYMHSRGRKKDTIALPPPLQTFLKHLHSLNILAGVGKKKKKAPLLSACHVCSLKETKFGSN